MAKRIYIGLVVVLLVFVLGGIFVYGDKALDSLREGEFFEKVSSPVAEGDDDVGQDDASMQQGVSGASEGDGESGEGGDESEIGCGTKQVQYSLRNFEKYSSCLESEVVGCVKMGLNCSVEVYNFNQGIDDVFVIRYSLVDSSEWELDYKIVEGFVGGGVSKDFFVEFVFEDEGGVGDLDCPFGMERVPRLSKC